MFRNGLRKLKLKKIKEEVIKKKVEKEIDEGDPEVLESFTGFNYNNWQYFDNNRWYLEYKR